mmetsp:Transcript_28625/g.68283  ORF Transcript_28625/g.68283 Transcript_28625/m.68283 type:complete len:360 (+) Transcript_28625:57-1136(+)
MGEAAQIPIESRSNNPLTPVAAGERNSEGKFDIEGQPVTAEFLKKGEFLDGCVVGEKPQGRWQTFFFEADPFKPEQYVRNAAVYTPKRNIVFALIYWAALAGYTAYAFIRYLERPKVETYSQIPMIQANPALLTVEVECTSPWGCFNSSAPGPHADRWWANPANDPEVEWLQIQQKYTPAGLAEGYCTGVESFTDFVKTRNARGSRQITLCYSRSSEDGVDIVVPFPDGYQEIGAPNLNVRVLEGGEVGMEVEVSMEASQVKTITVGVDILREMGEPEKQELFRADMFYNAKRPYNTALLRIRLEHRAGVRTISRPGSWMDVLANAGGASGFLLAVIAGIRGFDPVGIAAGGIPCLASS